MLGHLIFPIFYTSSIISILIAVAGIVVQWIPLSTFPARYTYTTAPSFSYVYDGSRTTANCQAINKDDQAYTWYCYQQGVNTENIRNILFSMESSIGQSSYTLVTDPFDSLLSTASGASSTDTAPITTSSTTTATQASISPSPTPAATTVAISFAYSFYSSLTIPTSLQGSIVSAVTPAPSQTVFNIQPARASRDILAYTTFYESYCLFIALLFLIASVITIAKISRLKRSQGENNLALGTQESTEKSSDPAGGQDNPVQHVNGGENQQGRNGGSPSRPAAAWNILTDPREGRQFWILYFLPGILFGIVAAIVLGTRMINLPEFISAGACGKSTIQYDYWTQRICGAGSNPSIKPNIYTSDPSNKPVTMANYAWPFIADLVLVCVLLLSMTIMNLTLLKKKKEERIMQARFQSKSEPVIPQSEV